MTKNPAMYNVSAEDSKNRDKLRDVAFDRMLRSASYNWVEKKVKFVSAKNSTKAK